jgi:nucleoside-diphosphate-sugar epimerase
VTKATDAFVTGGSGLVGGHLIGRLVSEGWSVEALVRSREAAEKVTALGAAAVPGDLFDTSGLADAMRREAIVFHVAGINDTCPRDHALMDRVNIEGTRSVIAAASAAGVERVVYTSSAAAIGEAAGALASETTPHSGGFLSPYARSKYLAEQAAFAEANRLDVDLVSVNPSSVQGPGRATGSAEILIRILNSRRPILVDTNISIVDIEDCTTGHIAAATHGGPGERYLLSARPITVADAVSVAAAFLGQPIRPRWVPARAARMVGLPLAWTAGKMRPGAGICPALVRTLLHGHRFDATRATEQLGVTFRPAAETLEGTARWLISQGYVRPNRKS